MARYSRGQAKPTNLVSRQLMYLQSRFFQILVPICETCRKTHLRSFSHDKLVQPNFWTQNMQHLRSKTRWRGWNFSKVCTCVGVRSETNQRSQINLSRLVRRVSIEISWSRCVTDSDSSHHTSNLGQCLAFFSVRTARWLVLKFDGQMPLNERKWLRYFPYFFQHFLGVPVKISGTISVYGYFLHNGSLDLAEIWPEASLNISTRFPGTFSAINEFPFILVGFACPRL